MVLPEWDEPSAFHPDAQYTEHWERLSKKLIQDEQKIWQLIQKERESISEHHWFTGELLSVAFPIQSRLDLNQLNNLRKTHQRLKGMNQVLKQLGYLTAGDPQLKLKSTLNLLGQFASEEVSPLARAIEALRLQTQEELNIAGPCYYEETTPSQPQALAANTLNQYVSTKLLSSSNQLIGHLDRSISLLAVVLERKALLRNIFQRQLKGLPLEPLPTHWMLPMQLSAPSELAEFPPI